ncbi:extracellular solute-binding protein [Legionella israelensis]|uniref:sn-glycerol-3-phosphate-binding periplasmic protein UgpB n=1 Tax=Legionella israelensis TaxID=454 RepID=A0AAX1EIX4_9GAMM|nr:extracellular solute-binding protein [Legionella israelensis]QBR85085.1 extracellular solute-binding protein [Legionella israelensis]
MIKKFYFLQKKNRFRILAATIVFFLSFPLCAKRINIIWWHAMAGHLGNEIRHLAYDFNQQQDQYFIKPVYKGDYIETLTSFAAAFRAHQPPDMVQVFEVGAATMLKPKGIIKPVAQLMKEQHIPLPTNDIIPAVRHFYSKNGELMAFPLNLSVPVLYYNAEVLKKIGYDQHNFPHSWQELEKLAEKLKNAGYRCAYTSAQPAWILVESYLAIHGIATTENMPLRAIYNSPYFVAHLARLKRWQELGYFRYGGRADDATVLFTSNVCPMYSQSSGGYNSLSEIVPFRLGVALLPLDTEVSQTRHANVAGGAALWVTAGRPAVKEKGIALFLHYLSRPDVQKRWHEHSGYLPLGLTGQYAAISSISQHPVLKLAQADLTTSSEHLKTNTLIPQHQIRAVNEAALETLFAGLKTPKQAADEAVKQANHLIWRYIRNTQS